MNNSEKGHPRVAVCAIVVKNGKVLVGRRKSGYGDGTWAMPGGKLEFGESMEECAKRELEEETGIKVKNLSFGRAVNDIMLEDNKHYITIYMKGEYAGGDVRVNEPDKIAEFQWVEWEHIPEPRFVPLKNLFKAGYKPI